MSDCGSMRERGILVSDLSRRFVGLEFGLLIGVQWWPIVVCSLLGGVCGQSNVTLLFCQFSTHVQLLAVSVYFFIDKTKTKNKKKLQTVETLKHM